MSDTQRAIDTIELPGNLEVCHLGPPLEKGALPTLFYFALSAKESLQQAPYNTPAKEFLKASFRTFSFTLPFHGPGYSNKEAVITWGEELKKGSLFLNDFLSEASYAVNTLIDLGYIEKGRVAASGLSRGGFIATHLAARNSAISHLLTFAPMSSFEHLIEAVPSEIKAYSLTEITDKLIGKPIRIYIGNRDIRVGTRQCFEFVSQLTEESFEAGVRSPPVELILTPSIGHRGHGTSDETFLSGTSWLKLQFGAP